MESPRRSLDTGTRDEDWAAMIRMIAEGDQTALTTLYDTTSRLIYGLVLKVLGDRYTAEEVMLDVYTQVWRQASHYDGNRGSPLAWLMTIARTRAIDRLRSSRQEMQRREPFESVLTASSDTENPEQATVISERQRIVRSALETLSPEQREVIELAYYLGLSHAEIAVRLKEPLGTVKTRARLAMIKLRDQLKSIDGGSQ